MRVFLSWSGERSRLVAELLDDWLQCVIQAANPWMSSKDIDRGSLWFSEITDQLGNTVIGIICLTKENKNKPWILFEAGALAKGISTNRVCTLLIDLESTDIENPLAQFNHSKPSKEGIWSLVRTINLTLKEKSLKENVLEKVFETYWGQFDQKFKSIIEKTPETKVVEQRSENEILLEVLSSVRDLNKKVRRLENDNKYYETDILPTDLLNNNNGIKRAIIVVENMFEENLLVSDEKILDELKKRFKYPNSVLYDIINEVKTRNKRPDL